MMRFKILSVALLLFLLVPTSTGCSSGQGTASVTISATPTLYTCEVVKQYPHDPQAFTEGLFYQDGFLYESTGLNGSSSLRRVELETGKVLQIHELSSDYFGEGIASYDGNIAQLTWQSQKGFVYEMQTFQLLSEFTYDSEGWGLTFDGERLIMSDGTSRLRFLDMQTFQVVAGVEVRDGETLLNNLNELEYIDGTVYANIWQTQQIVIINPETGLVVGKIDASNLVQNEQAMGQVDVLNGIAWDAEGKRLFLTGKLWHYVYEVKLVLQNVTPTS